MAGILNQSEEEDRDKLTQPHVCGFCLRADAKYTCPRCNAGYCSTECYKCEAHAECSETFYKNCVMKSLEDRNTSSEEKHRTVEMLRRYQQDSSSCRNIDEEEDAVGLAERLQGLNLETDTDKIWDKLTDGERNEFKSMMADGRLGNLLEKWTPWWTQQEDSLIEDVAATRVVGHPVITDKIPPLSTLIPNTKPSATIPYSLVSVLYAYCHTTRVVNGDPASAAVHAAQDLLALTPALTSSRTYASCEEAVEDCIQSAHIHKLPNLSGDFLVLVVKDVELVLYGPRRSPSETFVMAALSDVTRILKTATKTTCDKKTMRSCRKKVEFFQSWVLSEHGAEIYGCLLPVKLLYARKSSELEEHFEAEKQLSGSLNTERRPGSDGRTLIEEI